MEGEAKVPASPPEVMLGASHLNVPFIHHGSSSRILSIRSFRLLVTSQFQTLCLTAVTVSVHYITRCTTGEGCADVNHTEVESSTAFGFGRVDTRRVCLN